MDFIYFVAFILVILMLVFFTLRLEGKISFVLIGYLFWNIVSFVISPLFWTVIAFSLLYWNALYTYAFLFAMFAGYGLLVYYFKTGMTILALVAVGMLVYPFLGPVSWEMVSTPEPAPVVEDDQPWSDHWFYLHLLEWIIVYVAWMATGAILLVVKAYFDHVYVPADSYDRLAYVERVDLLHVIAKEKRKENRTDEDRAKERKRKIYRWLTYFLLCLPAAIHHVTYADFTGGTPELSGGGRAFLIVIEVVFSIFFVIVTILVVFFRHGNCISDTKDAREKWVAAKKKEDADKNEKVIEAESLTEFPAQNIWNTLFRICLAIVPGGMFFSWLTTYGLQVSYYGIFFLLGLIILPFAIYYRTRLKIVFDSR